MSPPGPCGVSCINTIVARRSCAIPFRRVKPSFQPGEERPDSPSEDSKTFGDVPSARTVFSRVQGKRISQLFQLFDHEQIAVGGGDFDASCAGCAALIRLVRVFERLRQGKNGRGVGRLHLETALKGRNGLFPVFVTHVGFPQPEPERLISRVQLEDFFEFIYLGIRHNVSRQPW